MTNRELIQKASDLYIQYVSLAGCKEEDVEETYRALNKCERNTETLEAIQRLLYIKLHKITGVIISNNIKVKYICKKDEFLRAEVIKWKNILQLFMTKKKVNLKTFLLKQKMTQMLVQKQKSFAVKKNTWKKLPENKILVDKYL